MRSTLLLFGVLLVASSCKNKREPDAFGTFEANEVVVSSEANGQLLSFTPTEGVTLPLGSVVGIIDTVQLALEEKQIQAQRQTTTARATEAGRQINVLEVQVAIARRSYERARRLVDQHAGTAQQLDQAERDYKTLVAQIQAARAQQQTVVSELTGGESRIAQIRDRIARSRIVNPKAGTVLATFVRAGEIVQPGQPLYRIAGLDTLTLRAYLSETQLHSVRVGQQVQVHVDAGDGKFIDLPGMLSWVSSKAEFTPTPVQTRDERADLVYAIKVLVPNQRGVLKIGMPGDVDIPAAPART
ncbi:MAG TPA: HlyD family efflux transporter periplasmic adaptor subunit [Gemmatimonadaceae bacterium]|nr:HlyD family efflux transporter periplasmic adaptor subunit [Gemmatimonadaceae bacterium]